MSTRGGLLGEVGDAAPLHVERTEASLLSICEEILSRNSRQIAASFLELYNGIGALSSASVQAAQAFTYSVEWNQYIII
ncbi:hypothetical protein AKJ16_DCAP06301 [Drosera capensis]